MPLRLLGKEAIPLSDWASIAEVKHHTPLDLSLVHPLEHVVDVLEAFRLNRRLYHPFAGEGQGLLQVEPGSDDRSAKRNAIKHHVDNRQRERARGQAIQDDRSAATDHAQGDPAAVRRIAGHRGCGR